MIIYILHSITHWRKPCPFKLKKIVRVRCLDRFKWKSMCCIKQLCLKLVFDITTLFIETSPEKMNQTYRQYWKALSLNMSTLYNYELRICVHACILRASWCKTARYCERNVYVCLVSLESKRAKFTHWMSQNLHSIFFFVDRLNVYTSVL